VQKGQRPPSFFIGAPAGLELRAMGIMRTGEIGIAQASNADVERMSEVSDKLLKVTYGTTGSVQAQRCLLHNHPEDSALPSQGDAKSSFIEGLTVEFTLNEEGIARIRYHFRQRREKIIIEKLFSNEQSEEDAPETDDPFREMLYMEPTKISGLPIDDGEKVENVYGVYDITVIPWRFFLEKYQPEIFFKLFRRNRNWRSVFSRH
jgi:hypothetical protein